MPPSTCPLFIYNPPANVPPTSPANSVQDADLSDLTDDAESLSLEDPPTAAASQATAPATSPAKSVGDAEVSDLVTSTESLSLEKTTTAGASKSSSTTTIKPCHFLLLPREIRDKIYTSLIPPSGVYRNWTPDLPRVFRRKCLFHRKCWDGVNKTCSWRGWNEVYVGQDTERLSREFLQPPPFLENKQRGDCKAMDMGVELCEEWMQESVGWNGLRIRETCKQVAEEAAEVCLMFPLTPSPLIAFFTKPRGSPFSFPSTKNISPKKS